MGTDYDGGTNGVASVQQVWKSEDATRMKGEIWGVSIFLGMLLLFFLGVYAADNPHVDIPVISQTVCTMKGDVWYNQSIWIPQGCYSQP